MKNKFDELTKGMAQAVTRRAALKKFGVGLVAAIAASVGIRGAAAATKASGYCHVKRGLLGIGPFFYTGWCVDPNTCQSGTVNQCNGTPHNATLINDSCSVVGGSYLDLGKKCSF